MGTARFGHLAQPAPVLLAGHLVVELRVLAEGAPPCDRHALLAPCAPIRRPAAHAAGEAGVAMKRHSEGVGVRRGLQSSLFVPCPTVGVHLLVREKYKVGTHTVHALDHSDSQKS